ncbi:MAG: type II secretion system F family protein [Actinobacteria bacterium]|jgi:Flp pilus assembly protein TadB|nr:type II secretion system F family protein [Actinomycetota bacterium]
MIAAGLAAGAAITFGSMLLAAGLLARPEPLADALDRLAGNGHARRSAAGGIRNRTIGWFGDVLARSGRDTREIDRDLRVTGRTREQHLADKLTAAVVGLTLPPVLLLIVSLGGVHMPLAFVVLAATGLAATGFVLPDLLMRRRAAERRRGFRYALSSYLDLVNVILAAGAGVETALADAADAGHGWAFAQLRSALARARLAGESPWRAFRRLGEDLDLPELRETASGLALAGTHGARVRASLQARAQAMRSRDLADMEGHAEAATERMSVPSVVLVVGFIVFVGYPAAYEILGF